MLCVFVLLVLICESSRILHRKRRGEKKKKHHMLTLEVVFCALRSSIAINKAAQFSCDHSHRVQSGQTCMEPKHTRNGNVR